MHCKALQSDMVSKRIKTPQAYNAIGRCLPVLCNVKIGHFLRRPSYVSHWPYLTHAHFYVPPVNVPLLAFALNFQIKNFDNLIYNL
jgi:hypothetical protein